MTRDRYQIVRYEPGLRESVLQLQTLLWGDDRATNAAYLEWKYFASPYKDTARIYLALYEGKAVGMRGFFGCRWEAGTPTHAFSAPCAGDLVVVPEHRGRGVFTSLMEHALTDLAGEGAAYVFNLSSGTATRLGSLALGWRGLGPLATLGRDSRPRIWSFARRSSFAGFDRTLRQSKGQIKTGVVASLAPDAGAMAQLVSRLGHDGRIRHVRDESYFHWRFRNPRAQYRFLYRMNDGVDGYLVLQTRVGARGWPATIVDFESATTAGASELLTAAVEATRSAPLSVWSCALPEASRQTLLQLGLVEHQVKSIAESFPTVLLRPTVNEVPALPWRVYGRDLLNATDWDLRQLYSDGA